MSDVVKTISNIFIKFLEQRPRFPLCEKENRGFNCGAAA